MYSKNRFLSWERIGNVGRRTRATAQYVIPFISAIFCIAIGHSSVAAEYPDPLPRFAEAGFPGRPLLNPDDGTRPLDTLVIFIRLDGFSYPGLGADNIRDQVFGPSITGSSLARFYQAWSNGSAFLREAVESNDSFGGAANDGVVIVNGGAADTRDLLESEWRRLGLDLADPYVDFSAYDHNDNGHVDQRELSILVIVGNGWTSGQDGSVDDSGRSLDGVNFDGRFVAVVGDGTSNIIRTHEFFHEAYNHLDLYCFGIGDWDIMGGAKGVSAFSKLLLGWAEPQVISQDGWYTLGRSDRFEDMLLLYDPDHGTDEYFLVENRVAAGGGLFGAPDSGLYIQRVNSSFWGSSHDSEAAVETVRPDGIRVTPDCAEFSFLTNEAAVGSDSLQVRNSRYFDRVGLPFAVILQREDESNLEEIAMVRSISGDTMELVGPLTIKHGSDTKVKWTRLGFATYFATELSDDAEEGDESVSVKRVAGTVPAVLPFRASLGGAMVTIDDITDDQWGLDRPLGRNFDEGTRLASLWSIGRTAAAADDAWDTADPLTASFDRFDAFWDDGSESLIKIFGIGPAAETTEIYVDVPADGAGWFLQRPGVHTFSITGSREAVLPWKVVNTGSNGDSLHVAITQRDGTSWGNADISLTSGETRDFDPVLRAPSAFTPPDGLELSYEAVSLSDPGVTDGGNILVDFPFDELSDNLLLNRWTGAPPDQRVFSTLGAGLGTIYSATVDFDGRGSASSPPSTISPLDDSDHFRVTLPNLQTELLPLLELPAGQPVPTSVEDCGRLGSIELFGLFGPETIELRSVLEVKVIPRDNFHPPADDLRLSRRGITRPFLLTQSFDCPFMRVTDTDFGGNPTRRVRLALDDGEPRLQRYRYDVEVNYRVQILRVPGDSIYRDLAEEDGRGIPCAGGFFPVCEADAFGRFETPLPAARIKPPGCPADGCPDHFTFAWQGGDALELNFLAPAATKIAVLDAFGKQLAEAFAEKPGDGIPPLTDGIAAAIEMPQAIQPGLTENLQTMVAMNSFPPLLPDEPPALPPSGFEPDPVTPERIRYKLSLDNLNLGLHFLQVQLSPDHDFESDPLPIAMTWVPTDNDGDGVPISLDNCPDDFNPGQADMDGDAIGNLCDGDIDGDGTANDSDACPATATGAVVDPRSGCSIEQICPCNGPFGTDQLWTNHGEYVSCVNKSANGFKEMGLISGAQKGNIASKAAMSSCGK